MNTEELNLSQPSLKINPTTLRTTLAGEISKLTKADTIKPKY
jgi:hypothetical protein